MPEDATSPIEDYLDGLVRALAGRPPRDLRNLLAEAEDHLRDDAAAAIANGVPQRRAEADAVARFGPAQRIAEADLDRTRTPVRVLFGDLLRGAFLLVAIGSVAVGLSGLVAEVIRLVGGSRALVDVSPGQSLSASDCARWLALRPGAGSCHAAAVADWADETVYYRLALGVVGVVMLVVCRRLRRGPGPSLLVTTVRDTVAVTAFGAAAVLSLGLGIDAAAVGGGAGRWFSAAPVAAIVAAWFAWRLLHELRRPAGAVAS